MSLDPSRFLDGRVGERVHELRLRRGLSLRELAGETISPTYVQRIEHGQRVPRGLVLIELATRLGTTGIELGSGQKGHCPYCGRGRNE